MDRFVRVLGQTELDPTRTCTNDLKGVDFFRILENFILETIKVGSPKEEAEKETRPRVRRRRRKMATTGGEKAVGELAGK